VMFAEPGRIGGGRDDSMLAAMGSTMMRRFYFVLVERFFYASDPL